MTADILDFAVPDDEPAIAPDPEPAIPIEPEDEPAIASDEPAPPAPAAETVLAPLPMLAQLAVMEILPADFKLPLLTKFVPNPELRRTADHAATYALTIDVTGPEGLQAADRALTEVRTGVKAIREHFDEPVSIANDLHKRLTGVRGEWLARGQQAIDTVGNRIYTEQRRLEQLAAEERRKAQAEADRQAREAARRQAEEASRQHAPAPIVEELKQQAETAVAPPVSTPASVAPPTLKSTTVVERWKARPKGTPASDEPNPAMSQLTPAQRERVFELMRAVLDGKAPLIVFDLNWSEINRRAAAEKSAFALGGFESFDAGGIRAKSARTR